MRVWRAALVCVVIVVVALVDLTPGALRRRLDVPGWPTTWTTAGLLQKLDQELQPLVGPAEEAVAKEWEFLTTAASSHATSHYSDHVTSRNHSVNKTSPPAVVANNTSASRRDPPAGTTAAHAKNRDAVRATLRAAAVPDPTANASRWRWTEDEKFWVRDGMRDGAGALLPHTSSFFGAPPWAYDKVVVVLHCGAAGRRNLVKESHETHLAHVRHVLASAETDAQIGTVAFPDSPGKMGEDVAGFQKYKGAQRAIVALLYANDTFGAEVEWLIQGDDDTLFMLDRVTQFFAPLEPSLPLFLAPKLGPRGFTSHCKLHTERFGKFRNNCCKGSPGRPCTVERPEALSSMRVQEDGALVAQACKPSVPKHKVHPQDRWDYCCPVAPASAEFAARGYPLRYDSAKGTPLYHWNEGWPYGGTGYFLSRGLMRAVGREGWERCVHAIQCENADQRVSVCVFNHGFSVAASGHVGTFLSHHGFEGKPRRRALARRVRRWSRRRLSAWGWNSSRARTRQ